MGSMDDAKQHMEMLKELGSTPPFSMEAFAAASRQMMVLSDGALGMRGSLELVGDAAAATGKPIEEVGDAVAKAYAMIRDGQPISRAANALRNMGLITPEVAASLDELQKSGASSLDIWDKLEEALGKYKGAMEETEQTGNGMIGAIQSQWDEGLRDFGTALLDCGKVYIKEFLDWLRKIREDGSLKEFVDNMAKYVEKVIGFIGKCIRGFKWLKDTITEALQITGDVVGAMVGGASFDEAVKYAGEQIDQREKERQWDKEEEAQKKIAAKKLADEKRLEAEKQKNAEKEKQRQELRDKLREREAQKEHEAGLKQQQLEDKWREEQQKEEEKARQEKLKKDAAAQTEALKKAHDANVKNIDDQIKTLEQFKDKFDKQTKRGVNAEQSRRWDGQSKTQLDPDTGIPQSVADMLRAKRFAKAGTEEQGKAAHRAKIDEDRAKRLQAQLDRGGSISKRDKKFLEDLNELRTRREADERIKRLNEQKDQAVVKMQGDVEKIKKNLEAALTLKN